MEPIRTGILTVSDRAFRGIYADRSGPSLREALDERFMVVAYEVVPDEREQIEAALRRFSDTLSAELVLTTGGTGPGPRDVTPEATQAVCDRLVPGLGEWMRAEGRRHTPLAILSRAIAGIRNRTLIVNLPGSPKAISELLPDLRELLSHAVTLLRGGGHEL
ncbi:MAG: molybdopterin adenylyltransferase [Bacteroidota bacterium]|nr:molybdopterin adenylyltransferase [Bacteroidota bacterium]MDW8138212.1 molybdopterin adenylyltransferase [Bacteroidota bacterium]